MEQPEQNITATPQPTETASPPLPTTATEEQVLPEPTAQERYRRWATSSSMLRTYRATTVPSGPSRTSR